MCVRERVCERERGRVCVCEREINRERRCVRERERERERKGDACGTSQWMSLEVSVCERGRVRV